MPKNIAVICGGYSGEAEVSFKSAQMVIDNMDRKNYSPYKIEISQMHWHAIINEKTYPVDKNDFTIYIENGEKIKFDLVFIMIHGTPGEDGKLQGYLEMIGLKYTSGDSLNTALTFNKGYTTALLNNMGFNVAKSIVLKTPAGLNIDKISQKLSFPVFVKPNEGGSSLGVSKVFDVSGLSEAVKKAYATKSSIIIEEFIEGKEFTCGAMRINEKATALHITEIASEKEFFDFAAKYSYDRTEEITPARLPEDLYALCQSITEEIFVNFNCKGVIRVDYILKGNQFYVIEINTIPGMTEKSIVPQQAAAMGIGKKELISLIIEEGLV